MVICALTIIFLRARKWGFFAVDLGSFMNKSKSLPSLTYSHNGMYYGSMPRAATTSDVFNAVAESRRREILGLLVNHERSVGDIVAMLGLEQPSVSKHLRVLRDVNLVRVRRDGRQMLYRTNADAIRPLHEWTSGFQQYWSHQLKRIKARAEEGESP
jgi:DNA-binding transcriptional ArsR family regulator